MVQVRAAGLAEKTQEKKRDILAAASKVFRVKGLHAAGMRDIAAELGMAVGNLYYYFRDKEDLLAFVQESTLTDLLSLAARVRALDAPADTRLFLQTAGHVVLLNEGVPGSLAHLEVEALSDQRRLPIQARRDEYERSFRSLVDDGIAAGVFRRLDAKVAALALLGAVNWTVKWFRPAGRKSAREIACETAELLVRGLLVPQADLHAPSTETLRSLLPSLAEL
ncbi:MAG TPA: TetR/AcrR family transcriptional regulator [Thermoanaerobaculia bacterium]|jgi:AcrR family transcriptional regulator|nr:TetR/AcrR family transcriptional regulator [Thermoanaerobaculia bacterium]